MERYINVVLMCFSCVVLLSMLDVVAGWFHVNKKYIWPKETGKKKVTSQGTLTHKVELLPFSILCQMAHFFTGKRLFHVLLCIMHCGHIHACGKMSHNWPYKKKKKGKEVQWGGEREIERGYRKDERETAWDCSNISFMNKMKCDHSDHSMHLLQPWGAAHIF